MDFVLTGGHARNRCVWVPMIYKIGGNVRQTLYRKNCEGPVSGNGNAFETAGTNRGLSPWMAGVAFFLCSLFFPFFCSYGAQHIVLYHVGEKDPAALSMLRKQLAGKGFTVSAFDGVNTIEKQVELANRINRLRAALFIALDFSFGEEEEEPAVTIAVTNAKRKADKVLAIEDVPGVYAASSREFADLVAESFNRKVLELPLFPLLGIDMPGVFLRIECPKDDAGDVLGKLSESMQKYFGKGKKR